MANNINEAKRRLDLIDQLRSAGLAVDQWGGLLLRDIFRLPAKRDAHCLVLLFDRAILVAKLASNRNGTLTSSGTSRVLVTAQLSADCASNGVEGRPSTLEIRDVISVSLI